MNSEVIFVTGISTEVGKTLVSAIITQALEADYWKPIQAGELEFSDKDKVQSLVSNTKSEFFPIQFPLQTPMSPHAAAAIDAVEVRVDKLNFPKTDNILVIEGAGGVLVPINDTETILDVIPSKAKVILVSRHYLGSINHTLLSVMALQQKGFEVGIVFSGDEHKTSESIITKMANVMIIGRVPELELINSEVVATVAASLQANLKIFLQ